MKDSNPLPVCLPVSTCTHAHIHTNTGLNTLAFTHTHSHPPPALTPLLPLKAWCPFLSSVPMKGQLSGAL